MQPPYEILLHQSFDDQIQQVIRKPLRKRKRDLESQLAKLTDALNRLTQQPHSNPPFNKRLSNFAPRENINFEFLVTRIAGPNVGKSAGHRLHYAVYEEQRMVFPFFLSVSREGAETQRRNVDRTQYIVAIACDYLAQWMERFHPWEGCF